MKKTVICYLKIQRGDKNMFNINRVLFMILMDIMKIFQISVTA